HTRAEGPWRGSVGGGTLDPPTRRRNVMVGDVEAVETLDERECWELLELAPIGRIALAAGGEIDIFPINFAVHAGCLWFRTAPGTKLLELTINPSVAVEIDGWDEGEAYSVVVKG